MKYNYEGSLFKQSVVKLQGINREFTNKPKKSSGTSSEPDMGQLKRNKQGAGHPPRRVGLRAECPSVIWTFTNENPFSHPHLSIPS
ncbi:MAG: hypothetical protein AB1633_12330 [Elusimicrobiota bacterium]